MAGFGEGGTYSQPGNLPQTPIIPKYQFERFGIDLGVGIRCHPPQTPPPRILQLKNLKNERFVMRSCGTKKSCQKILSESKVMSPRKNRFLFVLISTGGPFEQPTS